MSLSYSLKEEICGEINRRRSLASNSIFCHFALSLFFIVLCYCFFYSVILLFSFVVSYFFFFVIFLLSLIRERRGALLFALNEESAAKVIAADSSRLTVSDIKIILIFHLPAQEIWSSSRAPTCLSAEGIRERHGALLFAGRWSS